MTLEIRNSQPHIAIDARLYGPTHTGIGRYVQNLLLALPNLPEFSHYRWTVLVYPELYAVAAHDLGSHYQLVSTTIRHYSLTEQLKLPVLLYRLRPDLVHIPHFNKPLFYFGPTVVTIHDLIKHFSKGSDTTTHSPLLYWPKYWAYLFLSRQIITHNHLIVPTNFWRQYLLDNFNVNSEHIITTHEAVDPHFLNSSEIKNLKPARRGGVKIENYILYSGTLYPHKNIAVVFAALKHLPGLRLKIISKFNLFTDRTRQLAKNMGVDSQVDFLGFQTDKQMRLLFSHALAYVFPSFMEGFGLPGLEAQVCACPVISSNASCLPEVYGDSVLYFDPHNAVDLIDQIKKIQSSPILRHDLIQKGLIQAKKYSWATTARQTINYYACILKN